MPILAAISLRKSGLGTCGLEQTIRGKAIRSLAWSGMGGQEGSETSGVSPNDNPRHERPASSTRPLELVRDQTDRLERVQ